MDAAWQLPDPPRAPDQEPEPDLAPVQAYAIPWTGSPLQKVAESAGARSADEVALAARAAQAALERIGVTGELSEQRSPAASGSMVLPAVAAAVVIAVAATAIVMSVGRAPASALDAEALSARLQPSVVRLQTGEGMGSGFVIDADLMWTVIVTNHHVVASVPVGVGAQVDPPPVRVEGSQISDDGWVLWADPKRDIAFVLVSASMQPVRRARTEPKLGQAVAVMGFPLGGAFSVTVGSVSTVYADAIQYSAATNPGNSGGALVNADGEVIGVTTAKMVGEGIEGVAFAIPISVVCTDLVRAGREYDADSPGPRFPFSC